MWCCRRARPKRMMAPFHASPPGADSATSIWKSRWDRPSANWRCCGGWNGTCRGSTIGPDMTPEIMPDAEAQSKGMGEGSRLTGVFFEPGKAFADIAERPRFWVPLIIMMVTALCYLMLFSQHIGWEHMMRQQIENSSRAAQL